MKPTVAKADGSVRGKVNILLHTGDHGRHPLNIEYALMDSDEAPIDLELTRTACQEGCPQYGRNWSCPPFAPRWQDLARGRFLAMWLTLSPEADQWRPSLDPAKARDFFEAAAGRASLYLGRELAQELRGILLGWGQCKECGKAGCSVGLGQPCRYPAKRLHALEALGVQVDELVRHSFGGELKWWNPKAKHDAPQGCGRVVGVLVNGSPDDKKLDSMVKQAAAQLASQKRRLAPNQEENFWMSLSE